MQHVHREVVVTQLGGGGWGVRGGGGTSCFCLECDQKRDQAKKQSFTNFFHKILPNTKSSIYIFTPATPLVAPKMVKKFCAKTKRNVDV